MKTFNILIETQSENLSDESINIENVEINVCLYGLAFSECIDIVTNHLKQRRVCAGEIVSMKIEIKDSEIDLRQTTQKQ
jgi:hypothetical protein